MVQTRPCVFEIYHSPDDDLWHWRLCHPGGDVLARSRIGYTTEEAAQSDAKSFSLCASDAPFMGV